jgi:hypothetical protein
MLAAILLTTKQKKKYFSPFLFVFDEKKGIRVEK